MTAPTLRRRLRMSGPSDIRIGVLVCGLLAAGCVAPTPEDDGNPDPREGPADGPSSPVSTPAPPSIDDTIPGRPSWTDQDLSILEATVAWAREAGIDTLPIGERIGRIGERFVGTAYVPQTLDPPGRERLVVNLHAFDCVTFVESVLTLAHVVASDGVAVPANGDRLMDLYERLLTAVRYRSGERRGYPSRLHYFSEWIADNEGKGFVVDVTRELGGVVDPEAPTFMTEHRDAYWQLADPATFQAIADIEATLAGAERLVIPQERVRDVEGRIRTGDIIAATSTLPGLDVAHTGIALWRDGILRLMHAPLVGEVVQISERPLAQRLLALSGQDGILVARPLETAAVRSAPGARSAWPRP
jgi:hypothetical protein